MANTTETKAPAATKLTGKVIGRTITPKQGNLLLTIEYDGKNVLSTVNKEQLATMQILGAIPTVGQTVAFEFSVNTLTGTVSTEWVNLSL